MFGFGVKERKKKTNQVLHRCWFTVRFECSWFLKYKQYFDQNHIFSLINLKLSHSTKLSQQKRHRKNIDTQAVTKKAESIYHFYCQDSNI